ncbi:membrane protein [Beggiatoa sp. SS]|nr:membrane protein [Beggiatoa sp. SS]
MPNFPTYRGELPTCLNPRKARHYFLLAYWVFFRSTALKCYLYQVDPELYKTGKGKEALFGTLHILAYRNLYLMAPIIALFLALLVSVPFPLIEHFIFGMPVDIFAWLFKVIIGVAVGVAFCVAVGVAGSVAGGVAGGVAVGVGFGVAVGVAVGVAGGVADGVAVGVAVGVAFGVAVGVASGVAFGVTVGVAFGVTVGVIKRRGIRRGIRRGSITSHVLSHTRASPLTKYFR